MLGACFERYLNALFLAMSTAIASPSSFDGPRARVSLPLIQQLEQTPTSYMEPYAFFVSWRGVLTLAFSGWSPAVKDLKDRISRAHPTLPKESPGSQWPKTSIGCLRDGVTLTKDQFSALASLCKLHSSRQFGLSDCPQIALDSAAIAIYENRCLERLVSLQTVQFSAARDGHGPSLEEKHRIQSILLEADEPGYYDEVAKEGNRAPHYVDPALGVTLMHPLIAPIGPGSVRSHYPTARAGLRERGIQDLSDRRRLLEMIHAFQQAVDAALPNTYRWFSDASLHVTLRAIIM